MYVKEQDSFVKNHGTINVKLSTYLMMMRFRFKLKCKSAAMQATRAEKKLHEAQDAYRRSGCIHIDFKIIELIRSRSKNTANSAQEMLRIRMRACRHEVKQCHKHINMATRAMEAVQARQTQLLGPRQMEIKVCGAISRGMEIENFGLTMYRNKVYVDPSGCSITAGDRILIGSTPTIYHVTQYSHPLKKLRLKIWRRVTAGLQVNTPLSQGTELHKVNRTDTELLTLICSL